MGASGGWRYPWSAWAGFALPPALLAVGLVFLYLFAPLDPACHPVACCSTSANVTGCCASTSGPCHETVDGSVLLIMAIVSIFPAVVYFRSKRYHP